MKINGNNKKATVLTFNLKSMDTRMKLCAPSRLLPPHADLNNLNEATITFDDWCEIDEYIAVDNTTGEAFTESFKDKKSCLDWLANKEKTV